MADSFANIEDENELLMNTNCETLALHFKYCALIAVLLLVFLATERWSTNKDFTTYLSNAATMTSLLLGVVAIFYSFISNDGMSRSLGSITTVSNEVSEARSDIQRFTEHTKTSTDTAAANNELVRTASSELSGTMTTLTSTLQAIASQNETLQQLVGRLPSKLDQLETRFGDVAKALAEKPQSPATAISTSDLPPKAIERFLARATYNQNLLIVACVLANQSKKPLDIPALCNAIDWNTPNAYQGFVNCMHAVQLISRSSLEGRDKTYTITSVHPELALHAKSAFLKYVDQNFSDKQDERAVWIGKLAAVDALYS